MSYYQLLGFQKEPFSTSPDPDFFYSSKEHERALTNVLIELRLKRGLSVVLGDVGTGKTTLSRKLVQDLRNRKDCIFHMILDPSFESSAQLLTSLVRNFGVLTDGDLRAYSAMDLREHLERFLFQMGVVEGKTVVLVIDEAQKLSPVSLEALRVLLNYETNQYKLLQLVLLGQAELLSQLRGIPNFLDRISYKALLNPLGYEEMKEMIFFRVDQAGYRSKMDLFLESGLQKIFQATGGYPRKVTMLCHRALKHMILEKKVVVDDSVVEDLIQDEVHAGWQNKTLLQSSSF